MWQMASKQSQHHQKTKNFYNKLRKWIVRKIAVILMKPGLAVLPLDIWADVFESITRQELAQFSNKIRDRKFSGKLQKLLHDCGKQSLRYIQIYSKPKEINNKPKGRPSKKQLQKRKIGQCQACLAVSPTGYRLRAFAFGFMRWPTYKDCNFPEAEMPGNIKNFKHLAIGHLDNKVLKFLDKIKPLFTNVVLSVKSMQSAENMRIFFTHLLPMIASIRAIKCDNDCMEFLECHFPGTLALGRELHLSAEPFFIPSYLDWLNAPLDFNMDGPRFLNASAQSGTIFAIVDAVRKQFQAASTTATFVIFLELYLYHELHLRVEEIKIENTTTNEQLVVRNKTFKTAKYGKVYFVEIVRHPTGANPKIREWIEQRAYYGKEDTEKDYIDANEDSNESNGENKPDNNGEDKADEDRNNVIWINKPTIGRISKKAEDKQTNVWDEAGPSTSANKKMKISKEPKTLNQDEGESASEEDDAAGPSTAKKMKK